MTGVDLDMLDLLGPTALGDWAIDYARRGLEVFPLDWTATLDDKSGEMKARKAPLNPHGMLNATTNLEQIAAWWERWPDALIGCRIPIGVIAIDIDPHHGGEDILARLETEHGPLPATRTTLSGRGNGGRHLWFRLPEDPGRNLQDLPGGVDVLQHGHRYTILPPSPHPITGDPYRWAAGSSETSEVADLPAAWFDRLRPADKPTAAPAATPGVPSGTGGPITDYNTDHTVADVIGRHGWTLVRGDGVNDGSTWRHPTATSDSSATIRGGRLYVYSPTPGLPVTTTSEPNGLSAWDLHVQLDHAGDSHRALDDARPDNVIDLSAFGATPGPTVTVHEDEDDDEDVEPEQIDRPPFPLENVWPDEMVRIVREAGIDTCNPPAMPGAVAIAAMGVAIGNNRQLNISRVWHERSRIWAAIIADPSARKSPVVRTVTKPLWRIQGDLDQVVASEIDQWETEGGKGNKPQPRHLLVTNATIEALRKSMTYHPHGTIIASDELTDWLRSWGAYKSGKGGTKSGDKSAYLSMWGGDSARIVRVSSDDVIINNPHLSVVGGIQPDVLRELAGDTADGLAQRFLLAYCDPLPQDARAEPVSEAAEAGWERLIRGLYNLPPDPEGGPTILAWADGALDRFHDHRQRYMDMASSSSRTMTQVLGKMESYLGRIVVIMSSAWHVVGADDQVTPAMVDAAATVVDHYIGQARYVYDGPGLPAPDEHPHLGPRDEDALVAWVNAKGKATFRTARNAGPKPFRTAKYEDALAVVVRLGRDRRLDVRQKQIGTQMSYTLYPVAR